MQGSPDSMDDSWRGMKRLSVGGDGDGTGTALLEQHLLGKKSYFPKPMRSKK